MTTDENGYEPSHVEMWRADKPSDPALPWGWQCFRCAANELGYPSLAMAEVDAALHESTGCKVLPL